MSFSKLTSRHLKSHRFSRPVHLFLCMYNVFAESYDIQHCLQSRITLSRCFLEQSWAFLVVFCWADLPITSFSKAMLTLNVCSACSFTLSASAICSRTKRPCSGTLSACRAKLPCCLTPNDSHHPGTSVSKRCVGITSLRRPSIV